MSGVVNAKTAGMCSPQEHRRRYVSFFNSQSGVGIIVHKGNPCPLEAYVWYGVSHASIVHVYLVWMNFHDLDVTN